jgi:hypothetical protein
VAEVTKNPLEKKYPEDIFTLDGSLIFLARHLLQHEKKLEWTFLYNTLFIVKVEFIINFNFGWL